MNLETYDDLIPPECERSLEHIKIHLRSALESAEEEDVRQVLHDAMIVTKIAMYLWKSSEEQE